MLVTKDVELSRLDHDFSPFSFFIFFFFYVQRRKILAGSAGSLSANLPLRGLADVGFIQISDDFPKCFCGFLLAVFLSGACIPLFL